MREKDIIENIKDIGITTLFIMIFILIIPYILMGSGIKNFTSNENLNNSNNSIININIKGEENVKVFRHNTNKVETIPVEEYILGVVSSEMPASFELEALKAQAVAARTFYYSKRLNNCKEAKGGEICDSVHCQAYMSKDERLDKWSDKEGKSNYEKIKKAVDETEGMVLTYKGELVLYPQFFSTSSGKTENAEEVFSSEVPYLKSVFSKGEEVSNSYESEKIINNNDFINIINTSYNKAGLTIKNMKNKIKIKSRTEGGSVNEIIVGNTTIKGTEFRKIFDLKSANFTLEFAKDNVKIYCKGNGHGVGMSQWGANIMAKNDKKYDYILKHYYTDIEIGKVKFK